MLHTEYIHCAEKTHLLQNTGSHHPLGLIRSAQKVNLRAVRSPMINFFSVKCLLRKSVKRFLLLKQVI